MTMNSRKGYRMDWAGWGVKHMKTLVGATDNDGHWWMTVTTTRTREQLPQWLGNSYCCWKMVVAVAWGVSTKEWWLGDDICEIEAGSSSSCWWMVARGWWHRWPEESSNVCWMTLAHGSIANVWRMEDSCSAWVCGFNMQSGMWERMWRCFGLIFVPFF